MSNLSLSKVTEELQAIKRLDQLIYLGYFGEVEGCIPSELKSSANCEITLKCGFPAAQVEWCFRNECNNKNMKGLKDESLFVPVHRMESDYVFRSSGVVPFLSAFAKGLRLQATWFPQTFLKVMEFVVWDTYDLEPKNGSVLMRDMWEQILELSLQAELEEHCEAATMSLGFLVCRLVNKYLVFVAEREALLYRSVAFVLKTTSSKSDAGFLALSFLPYLNDAQRRSLAIDGKLLQRFEEHL
eukprot:m.40636 g.40636  ORF g.40636 m.40636 type:complete len:242 (+) comp32992_c0_seq1:186-911(+)